MTRLVLTVLLPLLLPTLLYVLWLAAAGPAHPAHPGGAPPRRPLPWPWLLAAGLLLMAAMLYFVGTRLGGTPDGVYVPPKYIDGQVVPGHLVPAEPGKR
jgi:drug/metabolite transporter (DMT)-like permease